MTTQPLDLSRYEGHEKCNPRYTVHTRDQEEHYKAWVRLRTDAPLLLDEVVRLREALESLVKIVRGHGGGQDWECLACGKRFMDYFDEPPASDHEDYCVLAKALGALNPEPVSNADEFNTSPRCSS